MNDTMETAAPTAGDADTRKYTFTVFTIEKKSVSILGQGFLTLEVTPGSRDVTGKLNITSLNNNTLPSTDLTGSLFGTVQKAFLSVSGGALQSLACGITSCSPDGSDPTIMGSITYTPKGKDAPVTANIATMSFG